MSQSTFIPDPPGSLDNRVTPVTPVMVEGTRPRQTEAPPTPFRELLAGGVSVLMGGAQIATHVLGAPRLAAAIAGAESRATTGITGAVAGGLGARGLGSGGAAPAGLPGAAASSTDAGAALPGSTGSDSSDLATMQAMQRESQVFNMQLLGLQEEVQQENRRFTTLSNVLRAKHDTAKAAVSNIRS